LGYRPRVGDKIRINQSLIDAKVDVSRELAVKDYQHVSSPFINFETSINSDEPYGKTVAAPGIARNFIAAYSKTPQLKVKLGRNSALTNRPQTSFGILGFKIRMQSTQNSTNRESLRPISCLMEKKDQKYKHTKYF